MYTNALGCLGFLLGTFTAGVVVISGLSLESPLWKALAVLAGYAVFLSHLFFGVILGEKLDRIHEARDNWKLDEGYDWENLHEQVLKESFGVTIPYFIVA